MDFVARHIVRYRKAIMAIFGLALIICLPLILFVKINYNMVDYLPPDAPSTTAYNVMQSEFTQSVPNTDVMLRDVTIPQALAAKQQIAAINGVTEVLWLDDVVDVKKPLETADSETVEGFYKNGNALFNVTIAEGYELEAVTALQELAGEDGAVAGNSPALASMQVGVVREVLNAFAILIPIILLLLILSTASWLEPVLYLAAIAVSIVINMGTNVVFENISFMTNSVSPILQLACSLDYAIFLLHAFARNREKTADINLAMVQSISESMPTIAASAATTLFGFLALTFMNFRIGADLGINLAKGIILSFITVIVLLPALTLGCCKLMDRLRHRPLVPSFDNIGRILLKLAVPVSVLVLLVVAPAFLGQQHTTFLYGNEAANQSTRTGADAAEIEAEFGESTIMVILVPRGDVAREALLSQMVEDSPHVTAVMSYALTVGATIPADYLDSSVTSSFYSANYARIIVYLDTNTEGDVAFEAVRLIREEAAEVYGDAALTLGQSTNLYDMRELVSADNLRVSLIAVIAIFFVLLVTFRSLVLPFLLLFTIEAAIWINLSIPYFTGTSINFIGYLVLSTVQLGATVDYAILLTSTYMAQRRSLPRRQAIHAALGTAFKSIAISGIMLTAAGFALAATTSNGAIADIGLLLGRAGLLSLTLVSCLLPLLLMLFDPLISRLTMKAGFYREKSRSKATHAKELP
ncbi:MAG: MMPL family transporter [Coriobacteriales bacterium]|jgi:predicted RND superfamily exporter protein|nr:MMPL family transporter [Coriobacteriales bacterium]